MNNAFCIMTHERSGGHALIFTFVQLFLIYVKGQASSFSPQNQSNKEMIIFIEKKEPFFRNIFFLWY